MASSGAPGLVSCQNGGSQPFDYQGLGMGSAGVDATCPSPAPEPPEPVEQKKDRVEELDWTRKHGRIGRK